MLNTVHFDPWQRSLFVPPVSSANTKEKGPLLAGKKSGNRVDSTRIVRCAVDSTDWIVDLQDTWKKSHKKANREGRKSGRIDSIRVDSTQIVRCVVDSTNWKVDLRKA